MTSRSCPCSELGANFQRRFSLCSTFPARPRNCVEFHSVATIYRHQRFVQNRRIARKKGLPTYVRDTFARIKGSAMSTAKYKGETLPECGLSVNFGRWPSWLSAAGDQRPAIGAAATTTNGCERVEEEPGKVDDIRLAYPARRQRQGIGLSHR